MNLQGKFSKLIKRIHVFPIFAVLVTTGCVGEPVQIEFPINHPANPEALETEFTPPHNPFRTDIAEMVQEPQTGTTGTMMKHKMPEEGVPQHEGHNMGGAKERRSDPESTIKTDRGEGNHLRKEGHH
jgi:hypothetical protein